MAITFKKRQKELKRLEKRREKEARREWEKMAKQAENQTAQENPENATAVPIESNTEN